LTARTRRLTLGLAAVGSLAGALLWLDGWRRGAPRYLTAPAERGDITASVTATGALEAVTTVDVGTYVSGRIQAIDVDYNARVQRGQRIAKIDPAPFAVRVAQAEASLATARARVERAVADLEFKRQSLERRRRLEGKEVVSRDDLDAAVSSARQAEAQLALERAAVSQAAAALEEARVNLAYTDIVSPVDGIVLSRSVDVGQTVAAAFQTPTLFRIAGDLTQMRVVANVSESDIGGVRPGQEASFGVDAHPGREFRGGVSEIRNAPLTVQNVVTYQVVIDVANTDLALRPGMTATVEVVTDHRSDVVKIPLRALRFRPDDPVTEATDGGGTTPARGSAVWVLEESGLLRRVAVETGIRDDSFIEARGEALAAGSRLVLAYQRERERESTPWRGPPR
jgi:HlyD family secretion protein